MDGNGQTLPICCGATAREILAITDANGLDYMEVESLPTSLHNTLKFIPKRVREKIKANRNEYKHILALYSDCGTGGQLQKVLDEEGAQGLVGAHCYEMYDGATAFATIIEDEVGCFFLTDYLTQYFERLVIQSLGLDRRPVLRSSYVANHKKVVYLSQRDEPALHDFAASAASRLELNLEIRKGGFGHYREFIMQHAENP